MIYFIIFMSSQLSQSVSMSFPVITCCYFCWRVQGLTWVGIESLIEIRDNGSSFIRILTIQKKILHIYKLGCLIVLVSKEINHSWSHSTFFMYLMAVMSNSMLLVLSVNRPACVSTFKYHLFTIYILRKRYQGLFSTQPLL